MYLMYEKDAFNYSDYPTPLSPSKFRKASESPPPPSLGPDFFSDNILANSHYYPQSPTSPQNLQIEIAMSSPQPPREKVVFSKGSSNTDTSMGDMTVNTDAGYRMKAQIGRSKVSTVANTNNSSIDYVNQGLGSNGWDRTLEPSRPYIHIEKRSKQLFYD